MSATRRTTVTSRRRSSGGPKLLGAVKLQSPLGAAGSDAGSPCSTASDASALTTPQDRSPLVISRGGTAALHAAPAAAAGLAQFSHTLAASRSSDRWLEERLASSSGRDMSGPGPRRQHSAPVVEPAASQIVSKALRFITGDQTPPPPSKAVSTFDSTSFLDKGMDAISGVGKLMEGFAITLDSVIGQAFEEWGSLQPTGAGSSGSGRKEGPRRPVAAGSSSSGTLAPTQPRAALRAAAAQPAGEWGQDFGAAGPGKENVGATAAAAKPTGTAASSKGDASATAAAPTSALGAHRQPHITSFMSKLDAASEQEVAEWRKRAQQLASELQRVRAQQEEYQRLRLQYDKLQLELENAASQASRLAQENSALKTRGGAEPAQEEDPLVAQQVAAQMEALLSEKSKLAAENDRLLRENTGLQELLEFTLVHQAQLAGDDELFGADPMYSGDMEAAAAADDHDHLEAGGSSEVAVPASA